MNRIICIIDMQNDFIGGSLGTSEAAFAVENAIYWLKKNLDSNNDIVFMTQDTHHKDYLNTPEGKRLPIKHCIENTFGWEIHEELSNIVKNNLVMTYKKDIFGCWDMVRDVMTIAIASSSNNLEIVFMGLCTDICVVSNALIMKEALRELDIPVKVLADCCAGTTPKKHEAALEVMRSCQIDIV